MQVILRSDVAGLGLRGDIVDVADGHARNFLFPKGHAMKATDADRARGAILGKAMEPLRQGERGQILVLVTLQ